MTSRFGENAMNALTDTLISESTFREEILAALLAVREKSRSLGLPVCEDDPQAQEEGDLLFKKYGATVYELAFASGRPDRVCARVGRALAAYLADERLRGAA
jgi:hypothetical protein